ncbi:MAG: hypothetical protein GW855_13415 [Erythrobacter sp.]|nr:hypothetical protein [Erythrobacter sp.]NCQ64969.1 hypothetical protein [Alphaproteobacteria bacterium]
MHNGLKFTGAIALALFAAGGAQAQDAPPKQTLMPENAEARAFQEAVGYSSAVIHGDTIYLSGVVAGPLEGEDSMEPAFTRAFEYLTRTLERLGATWDDVLVFDTFHQGPMGPQLDALVPVKNRYITAPFPAWTAVGVTELYEPTALVEIRLTVRNPQDRQ